MAEKAASDRNFGRNGRFDRHRTPVMMVWLVMALTIINKPADLVGGMVVAGLVG